MPKYIEKELKEQVELCNAGGRLNRDAVGWSRKPLHICNVNGRWPRKKKWNFWMITSEEAAFAISLASVDYIGLAFGFLLDFETKVITEKTAVLPFAIGCRMPDLVQDEISYSSRDISMNFKHRAGGLDISAECPSFGGKKLSAELEITIPEGHETLNVVIPWSNDAFQFTSKQNTMPVKGEVTLGGKKYLFGSENSYACQDFGRGVWPYRTVWNWAAGSGRQGDDVIGLQFGGKWTDGTGYNENGICLNGKLHKISEDMVFTYDTNNFMFPWTIRTEASDDVDLTIKPFFLKTTKTNFGFLKSDVNQVFGHFEGRIRVEGKEIKIDNIIGWSEEHHALW